MGDLGFPDITGQPPSRLGVNPTKRELFVNALETQVYEYKGVFFNFVAYFIGTGLSKKYGAELVGEESYEKNIELFRKYGRFGISILALTPLPYFPVLTGIFRMTFRNFLIFAIAPRIFHFLIFSYVIYYII